MFFRCITKDMAAILNSKLPDDFPEGVYLAGGTAVALYFGHRRSVDLDFFTPKGFDSLDLSVVVAKKFKPDFEITKSRITKNTLVMSLNDTGLSLFTYPYPLLNKPVIQKNMPFPVASQLDLALMKLVAINQRGSCKDFIDLKVLIEHNNYSFMMLAEKLSNCL